MIGSINLAGRKSEAAAGQPAPKMIQLGSRKLKFLLQKQGIKPEGGVLNAVTQCLACKLA
eukprot:1137009-Pelagomonas_calceolata.AAC.3